MALGTSKDQSRERNTKVRYVIEPKEKVTQQFDDGNRYKSIRFKQSIVAMQFNQSVRKVFLPQAAWRRSIIFHSSKINYFQNRIVIVVVIVVTDDVDIAVCVVVVVVVMMTVYKTATQI